MLNFMAEVAATVGSETEKKEEKRVVLNPSAKKVFYRQGNVFNIIDEPVLDFHDELPAGTYSVCVSMAGLYLERRDDFTVTHKIYGSAKARADRVINTFNDRSGNTGVLLSGEKGSGKTLLAKIVAQEFVEKGYIALLINSPIYGQAFNDFLANIKQPAVVIFDEFEKTYKAEQQAQLLTTFDGLYSSKKLFMVAVNEIHLVNNFFKNRPGRFMYSYNYSGLEEDFIREYCQDNLKNKDEIDRIIIFSSTFGAFNFDMLKHLVEDMNRYNEGVGEVLKHLNINSVGQQMLVSLDKAMIDGEERLPYTMGHEQTIDPMRSFYISLKSKDGVKDEEGDDYEEFLMNGSDLVKLDQNGVIYKKGNNEFHFKRIVKKQVETPWSAWA